MGFVAGTCLACGSLSTLHFVPAAPQPLVTVLIANQAQPTPRLLLRCSPKAVWERSLGAGYTYKGPVSLDPTASDWADVYLRDGDVFVQLTADATRVPPQMQVLLTADQARHHALWQRPFVLAQKDEITIWRPGQAPIQVTLPAGCTWQPSKSTFVGNWIGEHERWVPVPWIPQEGLHLCLRCQRPQQVHILDLVSPAVCRRRSADATSLGDTCRVRGAGGGTTVNQLRDGDVIDHILPYSEGRTNRDGHVWRISFLLGPLTLGLLYPSWAVVAGLSVVAVVSLYSCNWRLDLRVARCKVPLTAPALRPCAASDSREFSPKAGWGQVPSGGTPFWVRCVPRLLTAYCIRGWQSPVDCLAWAWAVHPGHCTIMQDAPLPVLVAVERPCHFQLWRCYLCPRGAPCLQWQQLPDQSWQADLTDAARVQEYLYRHWISRHCSRRPYGQQFGLTPTSQHGVLGRRASWQLLTIRRPSW